MSAAESARTQHTFGFIPWYSASRLNGRSALPRREQSATYLRPQDCGSFSSRGIRAASPGLWLRTRDFTKRHLWVGPVFKVSEGPEGYRARGRDLAVTAAAIMTRTAATAMAMSHRTQSMPGLPLPPNAV
jgi:hypothetical protein